MDLIQQRLGAEAMQYFALIKNNEAGLDIEEMYQAFKKRFIAEISLTGGAYQGVVYGKLEDRWEIDGNKGFKEVNKEIERGR